MMIPLLFVRKMLLGVCPEKCVVCNEIQERRCLRDKRRKKDALSRKKWNFLVKVNAESSNESFLFLANKRKVLLRVDCGRIREEVLRFQHDIYHNIVSRFLTLRTAIFQTNIYFSYVFRC